MQRPIDRRRRGSESAGAREPTDGPDAMDILLQVWALEPRSADRQLQRDVMGLYQLALQHG